MFSWCTSLKELNIPNFNTNNVTDMSMMFLQCPDELKKKSIFNFHISLHKLLNKKVFY